MNSIFLPEAEEEFLEAVRYYESEAPGVGVAFIIEIHRAVHAIADLPLTAPEVRGGIRKKVINNFPYSILYAIDNRILIVAVAHHKRRPTHWRKRVPK